MVNRNQSRVVRIILSILVISLCFAIPTTSSASNPCPNTNAFSGISNLTLWLRADCVTGNAADPADNSTISTWSDLSGNGNNATGYGTPTYQSDAANLINSQPVVNFNGLSSFTSIDIRAITRPNISIFAVYKLRGSNQVGIWGIDDGGWDRFFMARWNGDDGIISHSGTTAVPNSGVNTTTKFITTVYKYNVGSGSSVYDNGSLINLFTDNAAESAAQTTLRIGSIGAISGSYMLVGDIAEIIIFSQALSDSDRKTVNGYLNTKYNLGITSSNLSSATTPVFNSFALAGSAVTAIYRTSVSVTANVDQASKITFYSNGKIISGCKNLTATGSGTSFSASCTWKPSNRGSISLKATAVGISGGLMGALPSPLKVQVNNRSIAR
jgi:hypothetical protein